MVGYAEAILIRTSLKKYYRTCIACPLKTKITTLFLVPIAMAGQPNPPQTYCIPLEISGLFNSRPSKGAYLDSQLREGTSRE